MKKLVLIAILASLTVVACKTASPGGGSTMTPRGGAPMGGQGYGGAGYGGGGYGGGGYGGGGYGGTGYGH